MTVISSDQLRDVLIASGIPAERINIVDRTYCLPSRNYMDQLGQRFFDQVWGTRLIYKPEAFDCDDFSLLCAALARLDHGATTQDETAFAVGFVFIATSQIMHAVVAAVHNDSGTLRLELYEPQPDNNLCLRKFSQPVGLYFFAYF